MDKKILIGGAVVIGVAGVLFVVAKVRAAKAAAASDGAAQTTPQSMNDTGYFSSLSPTSGGASSAGYVASSPADPGNSGSTDTGGGFDIGTLLTGLFTSQTTQNHDAVTLNAQNYDSAVLASVVGKNGSATVTHNATGSTVQTASTDPYDAIISDLYQKNLGRAADSGGLTFYKNQMQNAGASATQVTGWIQQSDEYKKLHPSP